MNGIPNKQQFCRPPTCSLLKLENSNCILAFPAATGAFPKYSADKSVLGHTYLLRSFLGPNYITLDFLDTRSLVIMVSQKGDHNFDNHVYIT